MVLSPLTPHQRTSLWAVSAFDEVAETYQIALRQNLRLIPGGVEYYNENRVKLAKKLTESVGRVRKILDFGGGIGLATPHLQRHFAEAQIFIYDPSSESVIHAVTEHPSLIPLTLDELSNHKYDLIFIAGVLHHVDPALRKSILEMLRDLLSTEGVLSIFELNPLNPVTQLLVSSCPFDEDANLISKRNLEELLNGIDGLDIFAGGYTVFLPPILKFLRATESLLKWFPMGAQYYIGARSILAS